MAWTSSKGWNRKGWAAFSAAGLGSFVPTQIIAEYQATSTHNVAYTTGGTTVAANIGDVVVVQVHTAAAISAFSDNHANSWTQSTALTAGGKFTVFWSKLTVAMPIGSTFSITYGGTVDDSVVTGAVVIPTVGTVESMATGTIGNSTTPALPFTTGFATEIALMCTYTNGGGNDIATPSGWTQIFRLSPVTPNQRFDSSFMYWKAEPTATTDSTFTTTQTSASWALNAVTVKSS